MFSEICHKDDDQRGEKIRTRCDDIVLQRFVVLEIVRNITGSVRKEKKGVSRIEEIYFHDRIYREVDLCTTKGNTSFTTKS